MGNDLDQYRAAVGLHYCRVNNFSTRKVVLKFSDLFCDMKPKYLFDFLSCQFSFSLMVLSISFILTYMGFSLPELVLILILMSCMDIHPNPGPNENSFSSIKILHLNIRSIRNKIDYLSDIASDYDIVCITETHLDENVQTCDLLLEGFQSNIIRRDRTAHGGGIVVYIAEHLMASRLTRFEVNTFENIWLEFKFPNYSFMLCTVYRPPNSNTQFWDHLQYSIENVINYNPNIVSMLIC